ncbi:MAG: toll/interleukin-1 receptor domain-containing protein [Anaerolineae bacterium]|jgi:hypothetical protein|nr:toll/interleukin-1 receptor domain-containing protein [Anaerolineae bacterium]MBT4310302.1 toll/interleukin-1 receptor domain-containing protein [Anaerolineae bacterium]MBT4459771.1 toll/interleukin-1 receptor domain-containing protein [Anaerolineae bacterium]MBT4840944.1 toll/interleukin-1 receptor domain-containing protein [Anaerolineae bacterium]MBT6059781.1 toll/interleukin-1 receptor domain-containing protein [Anaerolineae bacterium]
MSEGVFALGLLLAVPIIFFTIFGRGFSRGQKFIAIIPVYISSYITSAGLTYIFQLRSPSLAWWAFSIFPPFLYSFIALRYLNKRSSSLPKKKKSKRNVPSTEKTPRRNINANIFICYRRADSENVAGRIYDRLVQHYGKEPIFKDVDSIPLGVDFRTFLDEKVGQCQVLLVIIGNQWVTITDDDGNRRLDDFRDYVRIEIESALKRNIPVIPLLVRRAMMPIEEELPSEIKGLAFRNGIQIRPDPDFHNDMERLSSALDIALGG